MNFCWPLCCGTPPGCLTLYSLSAAGGTKASEHFAAPFPVHWFAGAIRDYHSCRPFIRHTQCVLWRKGIPRMPVNASIATLVGGMAVIVMLEEAFATVYAHYKLASFMTNFTF